MRYQGGKARVARQVAEVIERYRDGRTVLEPFCGALNVTAALTGPRIASDLSRPLFSLYSALRSGWIPPDEISEETYALVQARRDPADPLTAFVGYGCSFGGKLFGGLARGEGRRNYTRQAKAGLLHKFAACSDVTFACVPFDAWAPDKNTLMYCDPPYAGTTGYPGLPKFDSAHFWSVADAWVAAGATVLVSEFAAPSHWRPVWSSDSFTGLGRKGAKDRTAEHVFAPVSSP